MRGKDEMKDNVILKSRITPAYAGKSPNPSLILVVIGDHPRLCGEKPGSLLIMSNAPGSPPPMRGKGAAGTYFDGNHGITPAYAGKSVSYEKPPSVNKDHPRLCGEK